MLCGLFFVYSNVSYERGDRFGLPFDWDVPEEETARINFFNKVQLLTTSLMTNQKSCAILTTETKNKHF